MSFGTISLLPMSCVNVQEPEYDTEGSVISCLQDFRNVLMDSNCQEQVHKMMSLASEDIRFNQILSDACLSDRERFCKDTQQVIHRCASNSAMYCLTAGCTVRCFVPACVNTKCSLKLYLNSFKLY